MEWMSSKLLYNNFNIKQKLMQWRSDVSLIDKDPRGNVAFKTSLEKQRNGSFQNYCTISTLNKNVSHSLSFEKEFLGPTLSMYFKDLL